MATEDKPDQERVSNKNYQNALGSISQYLQNPSITNEERQAGLLCKVVIDDCMSSGGAWRLRLEDRNSAFSEQSYKGYASLTIFQLPGLTQSEIPGQIYWLLSFYFAAAYEATLRTKLIHRIDADIIAYFARFQARLPDEVLVRIDVHRGLITTFIATEKQLATQSEMSVEIAKAHTLLGPMADKINGWDDELSSWQTKVDVLKQFISKQHSDLSFIGLSHAFSRLIRKKTFELWIQIGTMVVLAFLLVSAVAYPGYLIFSQSLNYDSVLAWSIHVLPVAAAELLVLYFFRIALRNYYSVKAQLLQLDLRYSLCAFVEGYADLSKRIKTSPDDKTLERFETLVFSGITGDFQSIPSQFDGLDQLANLIKGIRSK